MKSKPFEPARELRVFFKINEPPKTNHEINIFHDDGINKFKRKSNILKIISMPFLFSLIFSGSFMNTEWGTYAPVLIVMMLGLMAFLLKANDDDANDFTYKLSEVDNVIITLKDAKWIAQCPDAKLYWSSVNNQGRNITYYEYNMIRDYVEDWLLEQKRTRIKNIFCD